MNLLHPPTIYFPIFSHKSADQYIHINVLSLFLKYLKCKTRFMILFGHSYHREIYFDLSLTLFNYNSFLNQQCQSLFKRIYNSVFILKKFLLILYVLLFQNYTTFYYNYCAISEICKTLVSTQELLTSTKNVSSIFMGALKSVQLSTLLLYMRRTVDFHRITDKSHFLCYKKVGIMQELIISNK